MTTRLTLIALLVLAAASTISGTGTTTGSGFLLGGTAKHATDPENYANDVIKIDTSSMCLTPLEPCGFGTVSRKLNVKITALDNQLEFKSYFGKATGVVPPPVEEIIFPESSTLSGPPAPEIAGRSCGGGSPRIQLAIDINGDGVSDGNAFGHIRPPFAECPSFMWIYDDVTDELPRWDISQLALALAPLITCDNPVVAPFCPIQTHSGYIPWAVFEAVLATFPNHKVCSGALIDDSSWMPVAEGIAYYDLISLGRATWHAHTDTAGRGFAKGCAAADHPDDDHDGDCDRDHDVDDDDHEYDRKRRERWGD